MLVHSTSHALARIALHSYSRSDRKVPHANKKSDQASQQPHDSYLTIPGVGGENGEDPMEAWCKRNIYKGGESEIDMTFLRQGLAESEEETATFAGQSGWIFVNEE